MSALPTVGEVSYNGFTFPVETETVSLVGTAVQDSAKRTIAYVSYSITLHSYLHIASPATMDATMTTVRRQLMSQGGTFKYQNKGLGNLSVNVTGQSAKDVVWGPIPRSLQMKPYGVNMVEIRYTIDVAIPECSAAKYQGVLMEVNYKLDFLIDTAGYTTRTYAGYFKIPMTRTTQGTRTLPDNVDDYRASIYPSPIEGFRRRSSNFTIDESKTQMNFAIVDEEMGLNYPPEGIVDVKASHDMQSAGNGNFIEYASTISAQYEIAKGWTANRAIESFFLNLVRPRLQIITADPNGAAIQAAVTNSLKSNIADAAWGFAGQFLNLRKTATILPVSFRASEPEIYGRQMVNLSFTFTILSPVFKFLTDSLWTRVQLSNWLLWQRGLEQAWSPYGNAKLKFQKNSDAIIDLCIQPTTPRAVQSNIVITPYPGSTAQLVLPYPDPEMSWIAYSNAIMLEEQTSTVTHSPLATASILQQGGPNADPGRFGNVNGFRPITIINTPQSVIQQRSSGTYYVIMHGYAVRAGWEISPPSLASIGGIEAVPANRRGDGFVQDIVANTGCPIYGASWRLRYAIKRPPGALPPFPNPLFPGLGTKLVRLIGGGPGN